ncbi:MAG: hypothetical protein QOJ62_2506 [Actinomycetota bacterium]|nr:hypothetical protein [Actinomycetota bacterium]
MTDLSSVTAWIDGYVRAWDSNDPDEIGVLFSDDAEYSTAPYREPIRGRERIVKDWLNRKDEPGETTFEWHPVTITDEVAVVEGTTRYPDQTYSNLWVIHLEADGTCRRFVEWWMEHPPASA